MRYRNHCLGVLFLATIALPTACTVSVEDSAASPVDGAVTETLSTPALEPDVAPAVGKDEDIQSLEEPNCYTTACKTNEYCTSVCGDVAKCFRNSMGCGPNGCCVLM